MSVTKRQLRLAFIIGMVFAVVASPVLSPVLGQVLSGLIPTSGTVPVSTNSDVTVYVDGASDMAGTDFPYSNTVDIKTDQGNMSVMGNAQSNLTVAASDITGSYTNLSSLDVSNGAVTIDPEDKEQITVDGAATSLDFSDYALDDGSVDAVIEGPDGTNTDVTFYGLPGDITVSAVNATLGTPLDVVETNSFGQATFTIEHSQQTIELVSGDASETPEQSNPSPEGDQSTAPSTFSIDVSDADFPDDNVSVTIDSDGSQIFTDTITQNTTVTTSMPASALTGGEHTWTVNTTDKYGNVREVQYGYTIPSEVYIYNETRNASNQFELIDTQSADVRATLTGSEGLVVEQTVTNGVFDLEGYDPTQNYILTVETSDYFVRSVYLPNLYEQQAIFLLNESQPSTSSIVTLDDRTGNFDDNPVLQIQRVINQSNVSRINQTGYAWVTVSGDRLGADGQYQAHFEQDKRYRFKVVNQEGDERVLGEYTAEFDGPINLEIGTISYQFSENATGYQWDAEATNESGSPQIRFAYNDNEKLTSSLTVEIRNRETGTVIDNAQFDNGPYGEVVYTSPLTADQYNNETFVVEWEAQRDGGTVGAQTAVGGQRLLDFPLSAQWTNIAFGAIALLLAFVVGAGIHPAAGAIAVSGWSGVAWFIGLVPEELGAAAIILAIAISIWMMVQRSNQGVPS